MLPSIETHFRFRGRHIPPCNEERSGRRTQPKHRHQQFALSSLTGSGVEAEREIPLLLGSFATNDERKSPQMLEVVQKMERESKRGVIANFWS